ncbi:MAG: TIM barrel protein [Bryobacteraceae bacterium]|nr:TIM barrel protein [Bryobacteraceae bacterium]
MNRRKFLYGAAASAALLPSAPAQAPAALKGRLKQSATLGCFGKMRNDLEAVCQLAVKVGLKGLDLVGPKEIPTMRKYGLVPTMVYGTRSIPDGINRTEFHEKCEKEVREGIALAVAEKGPNVILLAGNRRGMPDEQAIENSVAFIKRVIAEAEDKGITLCLELLNSKVNHKDYQADRTAYGVEICKRVNSPRMKLLYDIYHMQIMEGDIIRTIRDNIQYIGHFHTAGNPGRHELDENQELYYPAIARAIVETGYTGYLAHEYSPLGDPVKAIEQAVRACDA